MKIITFEDDSMVLCHYEKGFHITEVKAKAKIARKRDHSIKYRKSFYGNVLVE